jgi:hypothetical protein
MSLTDRFYENNQLIITLKIKTELDTNNLENCSIVKNYDTSKYHITFSHQEKDGMTLILHFYKDNYILQRPTSICSMDVDFLFLKFFNHLQNLKHRPYFNIPNTKLSYSSITIKKSVLFSIYLKFTKVKFGTFLCALQVFNYFKLTDCSFCKLQIIHYLPHIRGINKTFPDVLIVPTLNFHQIVMYIHHHRKTSREISAIYQKYNFFSNFISLKNYPPQYFDVTFSNLPYPVHIDDFEIEYKSIQYEKSYLNILCNHKDSIFFSFVHDSSFEEMENSFHQILQSL